MFFERALSLVISTLLLGGAVACSDSEPGDDGGSSGAGTGGGGGKGGSAGRGGGAGKGGGAGTAGTAGSSANGGTAGDAGAAGAGGDAAGGTPSAGGSDSAGDGGMPGSGGDDGSSGAGGSSGAPSASDTLCGVRPGGTTWAEHVLRFETADGDVIQLERAYEMTGAGESAIYRLDGMGVRFNGEEICIGPSDTLDYTNTHHNWYDEAHATKDGVRYSLLLEWDGEDTFGVVEEGGSVLLEPTPVVWTGFPPFCSTGCLTTRLLAISEIVANNASLYPDEADEHEPLIELFNAGSDDVDLTGWTLSNAFSERGRWAFAAGTMLLRHETLVVFADGETSEGPLHASFELSADGGEVVLTAPDGTTDGGFEYGSQAPDAGFAYSWNARGYVTTTPAGPGEPPPELE